MAASSRSVEFLVLGPLEVRDERGPLSTGSPQQRGLLALLILNANTVVSRDRIVDELWGGRPPKTATKLVQVYLSRLRKVIPPELLVTQPPGYVLRVTPEQIDLGRFRALVHKGRDALGRGAAVDAAQQLRAALALWRGPALADLAYEPFVLAEVAGLEEERLSALEDRIEADLAMGGRDLVAELESLVERHPLRERLREQQMLALYRARRQADALRVYQEARRALVDKLGIEPGRSLRELELAILRQDPQLDVLPGRPGAVEPAGVFVGRTGELEALIGALEGAMSGRGRVVLVAGEPGIGKSRLADELMRQARARGARVVVGRCWEAGGAPAYWPWVQTLRALLGEGTDALRAYLGGGASALAQMLPELGERLCPLPEPPVAAPEVARFRLFEAITTVLREVARETPLVLVLDDLHAADASSLLLMQFVARELAGMRILMLGCHRDVDAEPDPIFARVVSETLREPLARRLSLIGLGAEEVERYVELTAEELATPQLIASLLEDTGGNPLFVAEIVRLLAAEGARSLAAEPRLLAIPPTVSEVIARRLERLHDECRRVLALAAVIGREFPLELLADVAGLSSDALLEVLEDAAAARIVGEVPGVGDRLRFGHVLMRDSLYQALTPVRRIRLHRRVLEALERREAVSAAALAQLAHHAIEAGDLLNGVRYGRAAGDRALAQLAFEEAARLYRRALEAAEACDGVEEAMCCELQLALGEARARAGDTAAACEAFLAAADAAQRLGLPAALARAAAGYGGRIVWSRAGRDERLVPLLEDGIAAAPEQDTELRAQLLARLAGALRDEPRRARRDELSAQAVGLARQSGDETALAYALAGRAHAILAPDTLSECHALAGELHGLATRTNDAERLVVAHMLRLIVLLTRGDVARGERELAAAERAAQALRQPAQLWEVRASRAMLALALGRFDVAERLMDEALSLGERAIRDFAVTHFRLQRFTLADFHDRLAAEEAAIAELADAYPARPVFRCALTYLWARTGQADRAEEALVELVSDVSSLPFDQEWLFAMSLLAEACWVIGAGARAPSLYERLEPWSSLSVVDVGEAIRGSVARYLGLLTAAMGRPSDAQRHLHAAIAANRAMGLRPWEARARDDLARVRVAAG